MKIRMLLSLLVLITVSPLLAQEKPKPLPGRGQVFGPVHTIRDERTEFISKDGQLVEGQRILVMTITFNEDGTKQERTLYDPNGRIIHRGVDSYYPDGRAQETSILNAAGEVETRTIFNL